jgi:hypothetical protein
MLDLAGDPAVEQRRVERFDAGNAAAALKQRFPGLLRGVANRGQKTDAGDYNSAGNNDSPLLRLACAGNMPVINGGAIPGWQFCHVARLLKRLLLLAFDIGDGVSDGGDLLGIFVGNFQLERFFKRHDKFHNVQ